MKRILYITGGWGDGGIENIISLYVRNLSDEYHCDVFAFSKSASIYTEVVESSGGVIIEPLTPIHGNFLTKNFRIASSFVEVAKQYEIIHYNTAFSMAYVHCLLLKIVNPKIKIIVHAHGDHVNPPYVAIKKLFHYLVRNLFGWVADYSLSCSSLSGEWMFTKRRINSSKYRIIKNATGLDHYSFDNILRANIRERIGAGTKLVIGTIGRIEYQKNPYYILSIIKELRKRNDDFLFLWIGKGEDSEEIKRLVDVNGLLGCVHLIDSTKEIKGYLSAMDVFILPSKYEGLGIVLLEAQSNGLITLASDTIPLESKISDRIKYLPITMESVNIWADEIISVEKEYERKYPEKEIRENGYTIDKVIGQLKEVYCCC